VFQIDLQVQIRPTRKAPGVSRCRHNAQPVSEVLQFSRSRKPASAHDEASRRLKFIDAGSMQAVGIRRDNALPEPVKKV